MGARPKIGITQGDERKQSGWWLLWFAVWIAGGRPCLITATRLRHCDEFDGLLIGGGVDVHPDRYRGVVKTDYRYDTARDELESHCFLKAEREGKPILGVCRGAQLINVVRGGTLCLDIAKTYEKAEYPSGTWARLFYRKPITVVPASIIGRLLGRERCDVNSMHTQSVLTLGERLAVTSSEDNGIVQSIEDASRNFLVGVQFHPEYLVYRARFRRIFREFVSQAARSAGI